MDERWHVTDHVCRICLGRVLSRHDKNGRQHVRCADCGVSATGNHKSLCACGHKTRGGKDAGMRCKKNPDHGPESTQEIVVTPGNPVERHPPEVPRGTGGKFAGSTNRASPNQINLIEGNGDAGE